MFCSQNQDDEGKKASKDMRKKGQSDAKKPIIEDDDEDEEASMEYEEEQSEHQAENQDEAESHVEGVEALSADVLDSQSLKDMVRTNLILIK